MSKKQDIRSADLLPLSEKGLYFVPASRKITLLEVSVRALALKFAELIPRKACGNFRSVIPLSNFRRVLKCHNRICKNLMVHYSCVHV